jgi:hypothetical protein
MNAKWSIEKTFNLQDLIFSFFERNGIEKKNNLQSFCQLNHIDRCSLHKCNIRIRDQYIIFEYICHQRSIRFIEHPGNVSIVLRKHKHDQIKIIISYVI